MRAWARGVPRMLRDIRVTVRPRARGETNLTPGHDGAPGQSARAFFLAGLERRAALGPTSGVGSGLPPVEAPRADLPARPLPSGGGRPRAG
eukprot:15445712-Alexandrium_andersonii.AAC.1